MIYKLFLYFSLIACALTASIFALGQLGFLRGSPPAHLGVTQGRLAPPSPTPNSISSQTHLYPEHPQATGAAIAPFHPAAGESGEAALQRLARLLAHTPGIVVVQHTDGYLRAEASTPMLKFVDDLEFWLDPQEGVLHIRSASRLGRKDFGTNRARAEALRRAFAASTD